MFVATTLALSLALSPVTTLAQSAPHVWAAPRSYAWMAAPAAAPAGTPGTSGKCDKLEFRAVLQVDTQSLIDDAQGVGSRTSAKAEQAMQSFDVLVGADAERLPVIVIKVVPITGEDEGFSFTIDINHAAEKPIRDGSAVGECKLCTESELLEKVSGSTRALMPKLRGYIADFNNKACELPPPPECETNAQCKDPNLPICHRIEKRCVADLSPGCKLDADCVKSPVGPYCSTANHKCVASLAAPPPTGMNGKQKAGIGLMIAGAVGVGVGVGLAVRKPQVPDAMMAWETRETQKPGFAVLAVGGAALVTGVVLFVLGRRQASKQLSRLSPMADLSGTGAGAYGLSWSTRF